MKLTEHPLRDQTIQKTQIYAVRGVRGVASRGGAARPPGSPCCPRLPDSACVLVVYAICKRTPPDRMDVDWNIISYSCTRVQNDRIL